MKKSKKKEKISNGQLRIENLDEILWGSTPLGKFQESNKEITKKDLPFPPSSSLKTRKYKLRIWVVRIPSCFVENASKHGGFQTLIQAESPDQALDKAAESFDWEPLDFKVPYMRVFPKDPAEDI